MVNGTHKRNGQSQKREQTKKGGRKGGRKGGVERISILHFLFNLGFSLSMGENGNR